MSRTFQLLVRYSERDNVELMYQLNNRAMCWIR